MLEKGRLGPGGAPSSEGADRVGREVLELTSTRVEAAIATSMHTLRGMEPAWSLPLPLTETEAATVSMRVPAHTWEECS